MHFIGGVEEPGQRLVVVVPLSRKDPVVSKADGGQAIIADQDAVKAVDPGLVQRVLARLRNGPAPAPEVVFRRALALDLETCTAVGRHMKLAARATTWPSVLPLGFV
ncbi:MAG: hypothetical protein IBX58_13465 [Roseovarius sp.]|nr:hypothetical protein [Roseovarius sp.]